MSYPVPEGLVRCEICGMYKGCVDGVIVDCVCNGSLCSICKKNRIPKPTSNVYHEDDGKVWHVPGFMSFIQRVCPDCKDEKQRRENEGLRRRKRKFNKMAHSLAKELGLHYIGVYSTKWALFAILEYRPTGERIACQLARRDWKLSHMTIVADYSGGFEQVFVTIPSDDEIIDPKAWLNMIG